MAPNNFGSALSKAALKGPSKGPLKGPLKAEIGRLQLISWMSCGVIPLLYNITIRKIGKNKAGSLCRGNPIIILPQHEMVEVIFGAKSRFSTHIESFTLSPRKSPQK